MGLQVRNNLSNKPFVLNSGLHLTKDDAVLLQDAGRVAALVFGTLLAKIAATGKYVPFSDETAVDGTAKPAAVYLGPDIPAADLVAGDVEGNIISLGGSVMLDKEQLVIENAKTLDTVIGAASIHASTVEQELNKIGIFLGSSVEISGFEN